MTNSQLTDLRTLILSEVGDFFAVVGSPGEPETPEKMQRELSMRLGRILNNHIVNYPRCEVLVEILRECRTARDEAQAELQERRKADSEPVAWLVGEAILFNPDTVEAYAKRSELPVTPLYAHPPINQQEPVAWDYEWASCITCEGPQNFNRVIEREAPPEWAINEGQARNVIPLYRHAQPAPEYPETLPCPVFLEPGMRFGKGVKTRLVLEAIQRRAEHCAELEAMTPEERSAYDERIEEFRALLPKPVNASPDFDTWFNGPDAGLRVVNYHIQRELQESAWNACRAAMLNGGKL
ncbi:hypothetical protein [Klebsiella aerogenes]|uniref:hypothetical protein n=1 Tax=Klebsiella aerogenes TaxID=548 RepID=UPI001BCD7988